MFLERLFSDDWIRFFDVLASCLIKTISLGAQGRSDGGRQDPGGGGQHADGWGRGRLWDTMKAQSTAYGGEGCKEKSKMPLKFLKRAAE